jgi:hypothetical protein
MQNPGSDAGVFVWNNEVNAGHDAANADRPAWNAALKKKFASA